MIIKKQLIWFNNAKMGNLIKLPSNFVYDYFKDAKKVNLYHEGKKIGFADNFLLIKGKVYADLNIEEDIDCKTIKLDMDYRFSTIIE